MKSQKALILAIIFTLLTSIFAMSDDGNNEPKIEKKEVENKISQAEKLILTEKAKDVKSNETVKDRLGVDTGMTKDELLNFKREYLKQAESLGIKKGRFVAPGSYFKYMINLNNIDKLKELGLYLSKDPFLPKESFAYNVTHSDIIVIGTIDSVEYFYETEAEEWKTNGALSRYFVKVDEILKGSEYFTNPPDIVSYFSSIGKFLITSGDNQLKIGKKYILFLKTHKNSFPKNDFLRVKKSALGLEGDKIYFSNFKDKYIMSRDEVMSKIRNYEKTNNSANFYKRKYLNKEGNNEK